MLCTCPIDISTGSQLQQSQIFSFSDRPVSCHGSWMNSSSSLCLVSPWFKSSVFVIVFGPRPCPPASFPTTNFYFISNQITVIIRNFYIYLMFFRYSLSKLTFCLLFESAGAVRLIRLSDSFHMCQSATVRVIFTSEIKTSRTYKVIRLPPQATLVLFLNATSSAKYLNPSNLNNVLQ